MSLRRLGVEQLDLLQLHRIDPKVPFEEQLGALTELVDMGRVRAVGLSNVSLEQLKVARRMLYVSSVQNEYNLQDRRSDDVLDFCESHGIAFMPWFPLASGTLTRRGGPLERVAGATNSTQAQVALSWLLDRAHVMLPIPGTCSLQHLEENCAAGALRLAEKHKVALTSRKVALTSRLSSSTRSGLDG